MIPCKVAQEHWGGDVGFEVDFLLILTLKKLVFFGDLDVEKDASSGQIGFMFCWQHFTMKIGGEN